MKIIFWNIGNTQSDTKLDVIKHILLEQTAEIICFAEGSHSIKDCQRLISEMLKLGYIEHINPVILKDKFKRNYNRLSLKVFVKKEVEIEKFTLFDIIHDGRIVKLKVAINDSKISVFLLHNFSKSGENQSSLTQFQFINDLSQNIKVSKLNQVDSSILIMGDYNLEPWDQYMTKSNLLNLDFMANQLRYSGNKHKNSFNLFTDIVDNVSNSNEKNLGGTYFSNRYGWSLYDYVIYNDKKIDVEFEIITKSNLHNILSVEKNNTTSLINFGFDHLPVIAKIKIEKS